MKTIQELQAEINALKLAEANHLKEKYQYLVGKCVSRASTSCEKIIAIDYVDKGE